MLLGLLLEVRLVVDFLVVLFCLTGVGEAASSVEAAVVVNVWPAAITLAPVRPLKGP
ncbi:hypothetical protein CLV30_106134 [Haloactinopolyspora alba]|uniref:Uncharacterized protein n=1 Tax=Haloactinopolyspora alba TaxID=648780 RepID=A0A2P8E3T5_9ACTN|nr:hypothetical protein CLV30_106134 [Haloactinopolyspora alba]